AGGFHIHPDSAFGPAEPVWMYSNPGTFYSNHLSGAFRMPNGNTFMIEGTRGRITEVDSLGALVWQYPVLLGQTGRAMKYPRDFTVGTQEPVPPSPPDPLASLPAIARGSLLVGPVTGGSVSEFALHDASGRRVLALRPGVNSVAHLAPGVYYARAAGTPARRVVLAR
ncbi:MAG: hypothetical protein R6X14_05975, partial [bacterium]